MSRRLAWTMLVWLGLSGASAFASAEPPARALVRETTDRLLEVLRRDRETIRNDPAYLYRVVDEIVLPHFDFARMSQRALGKHWPKATPEQQERFVREFQALLVRTYATALKEYSDQAIDFLPVRESGGEVSVPTQIVRSGGPPIPINYELHQADGEWKVFDVAIEGVSLVINYRSTFSSEIRKNGMEGLIERLAKHNAKVPGSE